MTGYIVARETRSGHWSMMVTTEGKVAVFDTADAAWAKVFEIARDQGIMRPTKVYELVDATKLCRSPNYG